MARPWPRTRSSRGQALRPRSSRRPGSGTSSSSAGTTAASHSTSCGTHPSPSSHVATATRSGSASTGRAAWSSRWTRTRCVRRRVRRRARASRRSRSASSTRTSTRSTRSAPTRSSRTSSVRAHRPFGRAAPRATRVRADLDDRHQRDAHAGRDGLPVGPRAAPPRRRLRRAARGHALGWRTDDRRIRGALPGTPRHVRAGGGCEGRRGHLGERAARVGQPGGCGRRRPGARAGGRPRPGHQPRHRRHVRRHRGGPRRPGPRRDRVLAPVRAAHPVPGHRPHHDRRRRRVDRMGGRGRPAPRRSPERRRRARARRPTPAGARTPTVTDANVVLGRLGGTADLAGGVRARRGRCAAGGRALRGADGPLPRGRGTRHRRDHEQQHGPFDPGRDREPRPRPA